jgi:heptaprenyl diphosphate synthase
MREGVYTLPVLNALDDGEAGRELRDLLSQGPPEEDRLARALQIVGSDGSLSRAKGAVTEEVRRAKATAGRLPGGPARDALVRLAEFLALRCGADA